MANVAYAARHEDEFFEDDLEMVRLGASVYHRTFKTDIYYGFGRDEKPSLGEFTEDNSEDEVEDAENRLAAIPEFHTDLRIFRLNLEFPAFMEKNLRRDGCYSSLVPTLAP